MARRGENPSLSPHHSRGVLNTLSSFPWRGWCCAGAEPLGAAIPHRLQPTPPSQASPGALGPALNLSREGEALAHPRSARCLLCPPCHVLCQLWPEPAAPAKGRGKSLSSPGKMPVVPDKPRIAQRGCPRPRPWSPCLWIGAVLCPALTPTCILFLLLFWN